MADICILLNIKIVLKTAKICRLLKNTNVCHFKTAEPKLLIFEYVTLEVYMIN